MVSAKQGKKRASVSERSGKHGVDMVLNGMKKQGNEG